MTPDGNNQRTPDVNNQDPLVWHPRLHEVWANERLYFWRLAFFPTYDKAGITERLDQILEEFQVSSRVIYEMLGVYDLILRVWLPTKFSHDDVTRTLVHELREDHLQVADVFTVGQILRHWPWVNQEKDEMRPLDASLLGERWSDDLIEIGNALADGKHPGVETPDVKTAMKKALAPCPQRPGIKFLVAVTSSSQLTTISVRNQVREKLLEILRSCEHVQDCSLYEGSGFAQFMIVGRVPFDDFQFIAEEVVSKINEAGLGEFYDARPYTYICIDRRRREILPLGERVPAAAQRPIAEFLAEEESQNLEVKASAFVSVERWLNGDGKLEASEEVTNQGTLRAIVGMLNSGGGTVILGAIEERRARGWKNKEEIAKLPQVGQYLGCGVDVDYRGKDGDWDHFALKLQQLINQRIDPPPTGLVRIVKQELESRSLAIVTIRPTDREWFYLHVDDETPVMFFVRNGNMTERLTGPRADAYKRPRQRA